MKTVKVIAIIGFIGVILGFPSVFSPAMKRKNDFLPALLGFCVALRFIGFIGLWHGKKWGLELLWAVLFAYHALHCLFGIADGFTLFSFIMSACMLGICTYFYPKMDNNL